MEDRRAAEVADEIASGLGENHVCTILYGHGLRKRAGEEGASPFPLLVIVKNFDRYAVNTLSDIAARWRGKGLEGPYILEDEDIKAMGDSIPEEVLEAIIDYEVLKGKDVLKESLVLDREHLRAQCELALRRYIFTLRWGLIQIGKDERMMPLFMENLRFYTGMAAQLYLRLKGDATSGRSISELIEALKGDMPSAAGLLDSLMEIDIQSSDVDTMVGVSTEVIEKVLQQMLGSIDNMGKLFPG